MSSIPPWRSRASIPTKTASIRGRNSNPSPRFESLKDFDYFTFVHFEGEDGKFIKLKPPVDYWNDYDKSVLTLHFTLPLEKPVDTHGKAVEIDVYDPAPRSMSDDAAPGRLAALQDFIRDQVERHWSLDLASLGAEEFSIPISLKSQAAGPYSKLKSLTPRVRPILFIKKSPQAAAMLSCRHRRYRCRRANTRTLWSWSYTSIPEKACGRPHGRSRATRKPVKFE